jgi:5'-nucleotidase
LWQALASYATLVVVAPLQEQSAVGLSITVRQPLQVTQLQLGTGHDTWAVSGTPADCVKLALSTILNERPCMVVSGINRGSNSGRNILYSGTVGAAIESVMQGIPGIAFSCRDYASPDYAAASPYIPLIVDHMLRHPLPAGTLLNVNFPEKSMNGIKGLKMTRQGKEYWGENPDKRVHPTEGHPYYWLGAKMKESEEEEDCDITWLKLGYVTAVPVHVGDLTDDDHLKAFKSHFENIL